MATAINDPLIELLALFITTPGSDFYLTTLIRNTNNPTVEPYHTDTIDLGNVNIMGMLMDITLSDVNIIGLSNFQIAKDNGVPQIEVNGNRVTFTAVGPNTEAPPAGISDKVLLSADFTVTPPGSPSLPKGRINVTITQPTIIGVFDATWASEGQFDTTNVDFSSVKMDVQNMAIDVDLDSAFKETIVAVLNTPETRAKIMDQLNGQLQTQTVLAAISRSATDAARAALSKYLGGGV